MSYEKIRYETADGIATVTLACPDRLNAYTPEMGAELVDAFDRARTDDEVRVVILTGTGKAYCAGVDLDYVKGVASGEIKPTGPRLGEEDFVRKWPLDVLDFPKPVIAALNGSAVGVGITMILPCDIRLAVTGAKLRLNFTRLGMLPGLGSTFLLPQLIGIGNALDFILAARTVTAEEAARIGLIQEAVAPEELINVARARAAEIAASRPEVTAAARKLLREGARDAAALALQRERDASATLRKKQ